MAEYRATDAKKEFFLSTGDLALLPCFRPGGWGAGHTRFYAASDLEAFALRKFGAAGLAKKRAARVKREERKLEKEATAAAHFASLVGGGEAEDESEEEEEENAASGGAGARASGKPAAAALVDDAEVESLRRETAKALSALCSWDFLHSKNSVNGCCATARLERVSQPHFAALIGRAADPELRSLVKRGAWYAFDTTFDDFFGEDADGIYGRGGRYGCNGQVGVDREQNIVIKYSPSTKTLSATAYVRHL